MLEAKKPWPWQNTGNIRLSQQGSFVALGAQPNAFLPRGGNQGTPRYFERISTLERNPAVHPLTPPRAETTETLGAV